MPHSKYYLNIGRATDLKDPKERIIYRLLEILPGFLIWITLIGAFLLSWTKPVLFAYFIISFCVYFILRIFHFTIHLVAAYKEMKKNLAAEWIQKLNKLAKDHPNKNWENIYHIIILPMYKEELSLVRETIMALVNSNYPKDRMIAVLATEERAGKSGQKVGKAVAEEFGNKFFHFLITCHPKDIPGEIAGKGSNEAWAGKEVKEKIIDILKIPYENIIVSTFDIDTQAYPQYFTCLTYYYLTSPNPTRSSFQPIPLYLNNIWDVPFFSRVVALSNVFWETLQQQRPEKIVTYSSHSMSFKAIVDINFWQKNVVSEDAGVFWKAFLFYDGDYQVIPFHYPLSMDCVKGKNLKDTVVSQYKQQRRWAWGSEGIPYLLFGFLKNKKIPFGKKIRYGFLIIEGFWAWATNAFLIFLGGWLPLALGEKTFQATLLAYNLPRITGSLMTVAMFGLVICVIISIRLIFLRPFSNKKKRIFLMIAQWIFFPFTFIFFGAIPAIDAQTRLMLGKYMGFWPTEKFRKK